MFWAPRCSCAYLRFSIDTSGPMIFLSICSLCTPIPFCILSVAHSSNTVCGTGDAHTGHHHGFPHRTWMFISFHFHCIYYDPRVLQGYEGWAVFLDQTLLWPFSLSYLVKKRWCLRCAIVYTKVIISHTLLGKIQMCSSGQQQKFKKMILSFWASGCSGTGLWF